jgi:hypothetical protein
VFFTRRSYPSIERFGHGEAIDKKTLQTWTTFLDRLSKSPVSASAERFVGMCRKLDRDLESVVFLAGDGLKCSHLDLFVWYVRPVRACTLFFFPFSSKVLDVQEWIASAWLSSTQERGLQ